jgi:hypothetical protein
VAVRDRTDPADALCDIECVRGTAIEEDGLHAPVQPAGYPGVGDDAIVDLDLDTKMSFDSGQRIYYRASHYSPPPFFIRFLSRSFISS